MNNERVSKRTKSVINSKREGDNIVSHEQQGGEWENKEVGQEQQEGDEGNKVNCEEQEKKGENRAT